MPMAWRLVIEKIRRNANECLASDWLHLGASKVLSFHTSHRVAVWNERLDYRRTTNLCAGNEFNRNARKLFDKRITDRVFI
jgi:hypothetical protein